MAQVQHLLQLQGLAADALAEGLALQQFHDQVRTAFVLSDVVNRADVGVIQSRGGAGFPLETLQGLAIGGKLVGEEFQSDGAAQARIFGLVDFAHAARADERDDLVGAEPLSPRKADHSVSDYIGKWLLRVIVREMPRPTG
jgi:hypothetical protein